MGGSGTVSGRQGSGGGDGGSWYRVFHRGSSLILLVKVVTIGMVKKVAHHKSHTISMG